MLKSTCFQFLRSAIFAGAIWSLAGGAALATPSEARLTLRGDDFIQYSLVSAAVGALIAENCSEIRPRVLVAYQKAWNLKKYARDLGVSDDEINKFVSSGWEKRRIRRAADAYLQANGVIEESEATYCALGRAEIQKDTLTGQLLDAE